ncbi:thiamine/molybdopterin biosynthesis protein [Longimycelium tulufanense]|uniref:Thiamine/molybdopterin biosynthesis protein n=1 Tax=Longimycelium tulufanense TaxID=907463 RepID=A0A8J3FYG2_9PSEU|nr:TOMM precursor leader peptide-binding protein [Longimycelium tulufanense]GGM81817.1 thiamine/molybdopterin biosynthesis protein [Longimycelium tulufanense]
MAIDESKGYEPGNHVNAMSSDEFLRSRPRLKGTLEVLHGSDGVIYLMPPAGGDDFELRNTGDAERELIRLLDGSRTASQICLQIVERYPQLTTDEVRASLISLAQAGLLEDSTSRPTVLGPQQRMRYDRQLAYFTELLPYGQSALPLQEKLAKARVAVLGLGGIGSWVLYGLASSGVGRVRLIDGDRVELTNLNRQILYHDSDIGKMKTDAAATRISSYNPDITIETYTLFVKEPHQAEQVIEGCDFVVEAADTPVGDLSRWLDAACRSHHVPHIMMSQFPPMVRIGPTFVPESTPCFDCYEQPSREEFPLYQELMSYRRRRGPVGAATGPVCGFVGSLVANEVMHYLAGLADPATLGRAVTVDTRTFEVSVEKVVPSPGCPRCATTTLPA